MTNSASLSSTSLTALRNLSAVNLQTGAAVAKLATGLRINRASDNPAGLISSEHLRTQLKALEAESQALERTHHVARTADAALGAVSTMLSDANAKQVQLANSSGLSDAERATIQLEVDSIIQSVDRIGRSTSFNGQKLLQGTVTLEAGGASVDLPSVSATVLGQTSIDGTSYRLADVGAGGTLEEDPASSQKVIAQAMTDVATARGRIGAFQRSTVDSLQNTLGVAIENVTAAESAIRDTNFALETAKLARLQTVGKAASRMLAIASANERRVLDLLK